MAPILTIFAPNQSRRRKLFFEKKIAQASQRKNEQTNDRTIDRAVGGFGGANFTDASLGVLLEEASPPRPPKVRGLLGPTSDGQDNLTPNGPSEKIEDLVVCRKTPENARKHTKTPENVVGASRSQKRPKIFQREMLAAISRGMCGRAAAAPRPPWPQPPPRPI